MCAGAVVIMLCKLIVLCCAVSVALCAVGLQEVSPKPDKFKDDDGCYISELDKMVTIGESVPSKKGCFEYRCGEKYVKHVSCGKAVPGPGYKLVEDKSLPYPGCCPTLAKE